MALILPIRPEDQYGKGGDPELGESKGIAIEFDPAATLITNSGMQVEFELRQIQSSEELTKALNLSASASGWGTTVEAKYASEISINKFYTYLLVVVRVIMAPQVIRNPRLNAHAYQVLRDEGWEAFEKAYGTYFLSGVIPGGTYWGLIEVNTSSKSEQREISVAVSGKYGGFKASGEINSKLRRAIENKELKVTVLQRGGSFNDGDTLETSLDEMIAQAKSFPQLVAKSPVAFQGIYERYVDTVPLPPGIGDGSLTRLHRRTVLEELARKYWWYKDYRANLDFILSHWFDFEENLQLQDSNKPELDRRKAAYQRDLAEINEQLSQIESQARACRDSIDGCKLLIYYQPTEPLLELQEENLMLKQLETELAEVRQKQARLNSILNPTESGDLIISGAITAKKGFRSGPDWEIARNGEDLEIREPEQNKVWIRLNDDKSLHLIDTPNLVVNGNADIAGEIRGKLWWSDEYVWKQGQRHVRMGRISEGVAWLTYVGGGFSGSAEKAYVYPQGGYWWLGGGSRQSGVMAKARMLGRPPA